MSDWVSTGPLGKVKSQLVSARVSAPYFIRRCAVTMATKAPHETAILFQTPGSSWALPRAFPLWQTEDERGHCPWSIYKTLADYPLWSRMWEK